MTGTGPDREESWRLIYDETCQPLFNLLCYQTGDRDVALDLLQETYVTAMRKLPAYQGQGPLINWLRVIALRKCLDWRRRLRRRVDKMRAFSREVASDPSSTSSASRDHPAGEGFQRALMRLPARQRAALLMRELEELSFREVAEALGCAEATARVHHHRACRTMRSFLQDADGFLDPSEGGRA